jgi:hypothetical protein
MSPDGLGDDEEAKVKYWPVLQAHCYVAAFQTYPEMVFVMVNNEVPLLYWQDTAQNGQEIHMICRGS